MIRSESDESVKDVYKLTTLSSKYYNVQFVKLSKKPMLKILFRIDAISINFSD